MSKKAGGRKQHERADGLTVVASNRRARHDYEILDTLEAGMVLKGAEVKSLRTSKVTIADSYVRIDDGELWVLGLHVAPYEHAASWPLEPERKRKLLAHRDEIDRWQARADQERLTIVPLKLYFRDGRAKLELGLARGRKTIDKRQAIAQRTADREAAREIARARRQPAD